MLFANRAGDTPLQIHLTRTDYEADCNHVFPMLEQFLASVATRIYSVDLVAAGGSGTDCVDFDINVLNIIFASCRAGTLRRLAIRNLADQAYFIWPIDGEQGPRLGFDLALPHARLEQLWSPITSLHFVKSFPYWSSRLYHNLTELRLDSRDEATTPIPESQLIDILRASPKLSILDLDIIITDILPKGAPVTAVNLEYLQVLRLASPDLESIFRWISPGSLPLELSLNKQRGPESYLVEAHDIGEFHTWSTIGYLQLLSQFISRQEVMEMFAQMPGLQTLVLSHCPCLHDDGQETVMQPRYNGSSTPTIYMIRCRTITDGIQWITEQSLAPKLIFWDCTFGHAIYPFMKVELITQSAVSLQFGLHTGVKFLAAGEPNPIHDCYYPTRP